MTLDEFFAALPNTGWTLRDEEGRRAIVRADDESECPWLYVGIAAHQSATLKQREIWKAADERDGHDPELRRRLLAACGLAEAAR